MKKQPQKQQTQPQKKVPLTFNIGNKSSKSLDADTENDTLDDITSYITNKGQKPGTKPGGGPK